jgi:hypothetical protein
LKDHNAGQLPGFKPHGFASIGMLPVPGDIEKTALETISFGIFNHWHPALSQN